METAYSYTVLYCAVLYCIIINNVASQSKYVRGKVK